MKQRGNYISAPQDLRTTLDTVSTPTASVELWNSSGKKKSSKTGPLRRAPCAVFPAKRLRYEQVFCMCSVRRCLGGVCWGTAGERLFGSRQRIPPSSRVNIELN